MSQRIVKTCTQRKALPAECGIDTARPFRNSVTNLHLVERAKISAQDAVLNKDFNNKILIIEPDDALSFLLKTTGEMQGYEVAAANEYDSAMALLKSFEPALIVLDAGDADSLKGLDLCKKIKKDKKFKNVKIVLSTVVHDKKMVLNAGADLYLPKP